MGYLPWCLGPNGDGRIGVASDAILGVQYVPYDHYALRACIPFSIPGRVYPPRPVRRQSASTPGCSADLNHSPLNLTPVPLRESTSEQTSNRKGAADTGVYRRRWGTTSNRPVLQPPVATQHQWHERHEREPEARAGRHWSRSTRGRFVSCDKRKKVSGKHRHPTTPRHYNPG